MKETRKLFSSKSTVALHHISSSSATNSHRNIRHLSFAKGNPKGTIFQAYTLYSSTICWNIFSTIFETPNINFSWFCWQKYRNRKSFILFILFPIIPNQGYGMCFRDRAQRWRVEIFSSLCFSWFLTVTK